MYLFVLCFSGNYTMITNREGSNSTTVSTKWNLLSLDVFQRKRDDVLSFQGPNIAAIVAPTVTLGVLAIVLAVLGWLFCVVKKKRQTEGTYRPSTEEQSGTRSVAAPDALKLPKEERLIWDLLLKLHKDTGHKLVALEGEKLKKSAECPRRLEVLNKHWVVSAQFLDEGLDGSCSGIWEHFEHVWMLVVHRWSCSIV